MLGEEIRARRKRLGLTQKALAALINVKPTTMCQYENGTNEMSFAVLKNIAEVLKCSAADLAYDELGMPRNSEPHASNESGAAEAIHVEPIFTDQTEAEIVKLLKDLDAIVKEKVLSYVRDQKAVTNYYEILRRRK
ncbi:helix-turn-helix domain-containing protein [uncultured Cloacibacillus sp.]|uniref:helix-turn-helix domain-containing protein n=1 Tax=uncultured Cloacibacillus sp. TaxID=889794 RepID=UPI00320B64F9